MLPTESDTHPHDQPVTYLCPRCGFRVTIPWLLAQIFAHAGMTGCVRCITGPGVLVHMQPSSAEREQSN